MFQPITGERQNQCTTEREVAQFLSELADQVKLIELHRELVEHKKAVDTALKAYEVALEAGMN